ncbi:MAG: TolC family protein [Pseudomonadota bacterium]
MPKGWIVTDTNTVLPDLWGLIDDDNVGAVVALALANNPNVAQSALRVAEAEATLRAQAAPLFPALSTRTQSRTTRTGAFEDSTGSAGAALSWEVDLWGRLRATVTAGRGQLQATQADFVAARNALAGRVIRTLLEGSYSERILDVEARRIATLALNERLIRERYLVGLGPLSDLEAARATLAGARARLLDRQERLSRLLRALRVLVGNYEAELTLPGVFSIALPGTNLPATVLASRPDVVAALARVGAADDEARAATRALLPGISLTLDHSRNAGSVGSALGAEGMSLLLFDLAAPLFQGGRLRADRDRATLGAERELWGARDVLLNALREVDDALVLEASLAQQTGERARAQRFSRANQALFESRYREGIANIFDLINAQQSAYDAEVQLLNTQLRQAQNRVDLGLALGLSL